MKIKEIRQKNKEELKKNLAELREKMRKLKFDISTKQVKDVREIRNAKKDIARIVTVLKENK